MALRNPLSAFRSCPESIATVTTLFFRRKREASLGFRSLQHMPKWRRCLLELLHSQESELTKLLTSLRLQGLITFLAFSLLPTSASRFSDSSVHGIHPSKFCSLDKIGTLFESVTLLLLAKRQLPKQHHFHQFQSFVLHLEPHFSNRRLNSLRCPTLLGFTRL